MVSDHRSLYDNLPHFKELDWSPSEISRQRKDAWNLVAQLRKQGMSKRAAIAEVEYLRPGVLRYRSPWQRVTRAWQNFWWWFSESRTLSRLIALAYVAGYIIIVYSGVIIAQAAIDWCRNLPQQIAVEVAKEMEARDAQAKHAKEARSP